MTAAMTMVSVLLRPPLPSSPVSSSFDGERLVGRLA
jgi:hypothetical protein